MLAPIRRHPSALLPLPRLFTSPLPRFGASKRFCDRSRTFTCSAPPRNRHNHRAGPRRSVIDAYSFTIIAACSAGIAYIASTYISHTETLGIEQEPKIDEHDAPIGAQSLEMASQAPPGRPGNLTPVQELKLKEMWAVLNNLCGLTPGGVVQPPNGNVERPSTADGSVEKKKRKGRLSLFGRKDKDDVGDSGSPADEDKHGQKKEYQQALASMTPEQLRDSLWSMAKHDDPDALYLRFLRARKWDVQAAVIMLISTMHWRGQEAHVDDDVMFHGEAHAVNQAQSTDPEAQKDGEDFLAQLRLGKSFVHGLDKENRPCCYVRVRLHRQGEQSVKSLERFTIYTIETSRMLLRPPVDTATIVFDMTDFSMANMDYTPVKFMIKVFEANYPESLGSVLVYKSPWIFQGVWKIIKGWLDPVVASKVHFASNVSDLEEWIPRTQIPEELGGDEDWTYAYVEPKPDENKAFQDITARDKIQEERNQLISSYEQATLKWVKGEDDGAVRVTLAQQLAENYWKLDPHIRARSLYDRLGVLYDGGKLNFYPPNNSNASPATGQAA
nr:cral-trio domain-containing protein c3h8.02 [Quercus suber]